MSNVDKLVSTMKARSYWVLVQVEEAGKSSVLVTKTYKTPFSRVLSVGSKVDPDICKVGDRVMFREGLAVNTKEDKFTKGNFLWVHQNNILGIADEDDAVVQHHVKGANGPSGPEATP